MRLLPFFIGLAAQVSAQQNELPTVIPAPAEMRLTEGTCDLTCGWTIQGGPAELTGMLGAETSELQQRRPIDCERALVIQLDLFTPDTLLPSEWYSLTVEPDRILIAATTEAGLYRGSRSLVQLLEQGSEVGSLPCLSITDWPRFPWRGMHLDVVRHFFPVEFVKQYIDLLARYKMNSFHWHLTDDQGWRIEIRSRPKLTEVGAWRSGSQIGPYARLEFDTVRYGGYYTQDEIREVVAYAAARHINVVPEIEMPGHALAALAAYPQVGCTGGPYAVNRGWGVFEDVFCAGNDSTFALLEDVLTEVMVLFPSPYIHIGGDECPKERWKECPKCQARLKAEGLKDEHELQSYFIQRIEQFVNAKGRKIIGWDEILEGGLAPNAAVMSWRGTEGGVAAAKSGHYAVMSPGSHCYFDHYQGDPANEPLAFGGYTPLQKVYSYEPIPAELNAEEAKYILGAQGNLWTEYILTPEHAEYMALPRMLALAEVLWTPKEKRDEGDFIRRLEKEFGRLEEMGVNASRSLYQVRIKPQKVELPGTIRVKLDGGRTGSPIHYATTMNYIDPGAVAPREVTKERTEQVYTGPFDVNASCTIEAWVEAAANSTEVQGSRGAFTFNLATARPITLSVPPSERYNEGGAFTLVDGITAQEKRVNTEWLGWKEDVTITVDLGSVQEINHVGIGALNETHSWIHAPKAIEFLVSTDGENYTSAGMAFPTMREIPVIPADPIKRKTSIMAGVQGRNVFAVEKSTQARYVRLNVLHSGLIPAGDPGTGNPAWMFLDEIEVR